MTAFEGATPVREDTTGLLIVGAVTEDQFAGRRVVGGAVAYAARVAVAIGQRATILTIAAPGADLSVLDGHDVHCVQAETTLSFAHDDRDGRSVLRLVASPARPLTAADLPPRWREARAVILAPLLPDDIDIDSFAALPGVRERLLIAQGLQRVVDGASAVTHRCAPAGALIRAATRTTDVVLAAGEVAQWAASDLQRVAMGARRFVITRGAEGAEIHERGSIVRVPAVAANAVDTTGAGDVFATALFLMREQSLDRSGAIAARYAAASLQRVGAEPLPALDEIVATLDARESHPDASAGRNAVILAVTNQKGGVGKTTSAVSLGAAVAESGLRVVLIDADPQANATAALGAQRAESGALYAALTDESALTPSIVETATPRLSLLPGSTALAGAEVELVNLPAREFRMRRALAPLREQYDMMIIDCPPSLGLLTVNVLAAADEVLIPVQCEYLALEGLGQLAHAVDLVRTNLNPALRIRGVLLTMHDGRTNLARQVEEEVRKHFPSTFATVIPRSVRLAEAPSHGEPIQQYDPQSPGARAYAAAAAELLQTIPHPLPTALPAPPGGGHDDDA